MSLVDLLIIAMAATAAGAVNALAGGGTLISFPVLLAMGVPPIAANVTNSVALCPGYFGATLTQLENLRGQRARLWICVPAGVAGGLAGGMILLKTHEQTFQVLVPYMLFLASGLLAVQDWVRAAVVNRLSNPQHGSHPRWVAVPVAMAGVYGGFFSAGMSVIVLAVLGATLDDTLTRLNALKQAVSFSVNIAAAIFFLFSDQVVWTVAVVMAVGALLGGALGGSIAGRMRPDVLRWMVVSVGMALAIYYWVG